MRDDDFDQRRLSRTAALDVAGDRARVPGKQTVVEGEHQRGVDGPAVPGKRTLVDTLAQYTQGVAQGPDPVLETEFHVRKARELMAALQAQPTPARERVLRADLRCHVEDAQRWAGRCLGGERASDAMSLMLKLTTEVAAIPSTRDAKHDEPAAIAKRGLEGPGQQLPFRDEIQRAFGPHDVSGIRAHVGGPAADASRDLGAHAYAHGDHVAFASEPSKFLAAHEATHVVQQRAGVALKGIDGGSGDVHEQHADAVAHAVVRGESAAPLLAHLPTTGGHGSQAVQRKGEGAASSPAPATASAPRLAGKELYLSRNAEHLWAAVGDYLQRINFPVPDARLQWRDEAAFTRSLVQTLRGSVELGDRARLLAVLYPAQPFGALDGIVPLDKKGDPLDLTWAPAVGHALAPMFVDAVVASLQRLGPRWVAAAEHQPERTGTLDETKSLVAFGSLVTSAPIDVSVSTALTSSAVVELIGNTKQKSEKPRPLRKLKQFAWQGPKLWNWIKVTDPADATAEEVAASLWPHAATDKTGPASFYAYGITAAPPLFGIPPTWAVQFDDAKHFAPAKVAEGSHEQRLVEVAGSSAADELALAQAGQPSGVRHAPVEQLRSTLGDSATQLNYLIATLARFKQDAPIATALRWVFVRQTELASATPQDAAKWEAAITQQKAHLTTIVAGVQQIATSENVGAEPIRRVLSTYAHAAGVSFMAASCEQLVASALAQQGSLALQGLRGTAADLQESVAQYQQASGHSLDPKRFDNPEDLVARCNELQSQMLAGKQVDGTALETTMLEAQEVALHAKIDGLRAQLAQLRGQAAQIGDGMLSMIVAQFHGSFRSVGDAADALEGELSTVEEVWRADARFASMTTSAGADRDNNMRASRRKLLDAAQQRFTQIAGNGNSKISMFLRDAASALQSQAKYVQIAAICVQLIAMLGISFVASAAGGAVSRFVGGLLVRGGGAELAELSLGARTLAVAGRVATFGADIATQAAVNVAGQHALGQKDEDAGIGTEMIENMIMIGGAELILNRIAKELAFAEKLEQEAGVMAKTGAGAKLAVSTATITTHAVLNIALSYVARQVTIAAGVRKESPKTLAANTTQLNEWFMQGISIALGRFVHSRFEPRMELYKKLATLPNLPRARLLAPRADSLLKLGASAETHPSGDLALQLMGGPREVLTEEKTVLDELAQNPAARNAAGISATELAVAQHQNSADRADVHVPGSESVPLLNAGLEDLGGGKLWSGTGKQIEHALEGARKAGLTVHDANTNGIHNLTIEGKAFEIHERGAVGKESAKTGTPEVRHEGTSDTTAPRAHEPTAQEAHSALSNWSAVRSRIAVGEIPPEASLPPTPGNRAGITRLREVMVDRHIPAEVRAEYLRELTARLAGMQEPPQDLHGDMKAIAYGHPERFLRKGGRLTARDFQKLGGLKRALSLKWLASKATPELLARAAKLDKSIASDPRGYTWPMAQKVVDLIKDGQLDFDPARDVDRQAVVGNWPPGASGWYFASHDVTEGTTPKDLTTQLAVAPEYNDGYQIAEVPEGLAVSHSTPDSGAFRPTALDLTSAPEGLMNPDHTEPHGRTNPQAAGQVPTREVVMAPLPLAELKRGPLVMK